MMVERNERKDVSVSNHDQLPPLEVIIVGAGIAGLAAGIAFRRAGHNVTVCMCVCYSELM